MLRFYDFRIAIEASGDDPEITDKLWKAIVAPAKAALHRAVRDALRGVDATPHPTLRQVEGPFFFAPAPDAPCADECDTSDCWSGVGVVWVRQGPEGDVLCDCPHHMAPWR